MTPPDSGSQSVGRLEGVSLGAAQGWKLPVAARKAATACSYSA